MGSRCQSWSRSYNLCIVISVAVALGSMDVYTVRLKNATVRICLYICVMLYTRRQWQQAVLALLQWHGREERLGARVQCFGEHNVF